MGMKTGWVVGTVAALVVLVAAPVAIGALLRKDGTASRSEAFPTPPERLWPIVLSEFHRRNNGSFGIAESDPPKRLRTSVVNPRLPYAGTWTYELEPYGSGTRLSIVEQSRVSSPLARFMARLVLNRDRALEDYFVDVRRATLLAAPD